VSTALVLGSNGQDGSYLAEILLERGQAVVGVARQAQSRWVAHPNFRHVALDVGTPQALGELLRDVMPDQIAALAAVHGSAGHAYEVDWRGALDTNVGSIHTCLEYLRRDAPGARLFIASSLKAFGQTPPTVIDAQTPRVSSCLYGITKNAAADLVDYYRTAHGVFASIGYFFNHDSPRRPPDYFLPRLTGQLAAHLLAGEPQPPATTLDFWCDWGSSLEFMRTVADLLALPQPHDAVIATGVSIYAGWLADALSEAAGIAPDVWVKTDQTQQPGAATTGPPYRANIDRLQRLVGAPVSDGLDVALWILREQHGIELHRPIGSQLSAPPGQAGTIK
jgi:GDPmannose 4,6-dehydratase